MSGTSCLASPAREWANLLRHLDADALGALAAGLERLDAGLPLDSRWLASEAVLFANAWVQPPPAAPAAALHGGDFSWVSQCAWRYGFSTALTLADHGMSLLRLAERARALTVRSAVDLPAMDRLFTDYSSTPNPVTALMTRMTLEDRSLRAAMRHRLEVIATIRLLRMAVQHAAGETVTPLPDPSGGLLQWSVDADGNAEFWSDVDRKHGFLRMPR
jgi:hypothetical protein